ncbi:MAG: hypothetical protein A4S09_04610 [Proteobacteria bacterium SG_bin7]|nr:MAG: hypothetical protein A4S09_04610 [Proteobacteria bacterium SG_bin7]
MKSLATLSLVVFSLTSNLAVALDRCPDDTKVKDPGNLLERTGDALFNKLPDNFIRIAKGNAEYQGIAWNVTGTGSCLLKTFDGLKDQDGNIDTKTPLNTEDYKKFGTRFQRRVECFLQSITDTTINVTDGVGNLTEGIVKYSADALNIDAVNLAQAGLGVAGESMQKAAKSRNFFMGGLSSMLGLGSSGLGLFAQAGGEILKRVSAIINVTFQLPHIPQHMIRGLGRAVLGADLAEAYKEIKIVDKDGNSQPGPLASKLMETIPNFVYGALLGCMPNDIGQPGMVTVVIPYADARMGYDPRFPGVNTQGYRDPRSN